MIGIYKITNLVNNKVYIGSSKNIENRFYNHKIKLKKNKHINKHLQSAFNKYSIINFKFEILRECSIGILRRAEQFYINKYQSINNKYGYNKAVVKTNCWEDHEKLTKEKDRLYFGCYDKQGKLVKVFRNIHEVYKFLNCRHTRIYHSCKYESTISCKGYYWIRININIEKVKSRICLPSRKGRHRKINQCDLNNNIIKTWNSAVEAANSLNLTSFSITRCLSKDNKYKNYKWYYSAP